MHPIDIMFSTGMVLAFTTILFSGVILILATLFGHRGATELVSNTIVSGRMQIICMLSLTVVARFFDAYMLKLTAYATLYAGIVFCIVFTGFWMAARHVKLTRYSDTSTRRRTALNMHTSTTQ